MFRLADNQKLERNWPTLTPDPTPAEIQAACLVIQSGWDSKTRQIRAGCYARRRVEVDVVDERELVEG